MLAMQYSFTLPADYDMAIIRTRIATNGHKTDGFPGLVFKAYLLAQRQDGDAAPRENIYAPFYLWEGNSGMNGFLGSAGFQGLAGSFGWPSVRTWSVWHARWNAQAIGTARWASRSVEPITPYSDLADLAERETERNGTAMARGALAAVCGFEPTCWSVVRFRLWPSECGALAEGRRSVYEVGHMSLTEYLDMPMSAS